MKLPKPPSATASTRLSSRPLTALRRSLFLALALVACTSGPAAAATRKVACVGDSITYGARIERREWLSYPAQLSHMLGDAYEVRNFGVSGATLLKKGNSPYWKKPAYREALRWNPDIVVIKLGTNDTKLVNWRHKSEFAGDLEALANSFLNLPSRPEVYLGLPVPAFLDGDRINGGRVRDGVLPVIRSMAAKLGLPVIDFHSRLQGKESLFPDRIHPNAEGAFELAAEVRETITGTPFPESFQNVKDQWTAGLPPLASRWNGFAKHDFTLAGASCSVVRPKHAAPGNPWIWRARFFGHEPQTDIALLNRGWHLAYCDVADLLGSPRAVKRWNTFHQFATDKLGLAEKAALEGMSRGGLIVFNWAAENPGKVASIYADAPVCDIKSWPGGKGAGDGHPPTWKKCLKAYAFQNEAEALAYRQNPVDRAPKLARGGFPVLIVYGTSDTTVPPAENCRKFARAFQAAGGRLKMIAKENCGHHPHSLKDPSPIVEFIEAARP